MNACLHSPKTVETCIHNPKSGKINIGHRGQNIDMVKADIAFAMSESGPINALKSGLDTNMPRGYKSGDESRMKIVEAIRNNRETSRRYLSKSLVISSSDIQ